MYRHSFILNIDFLIYHLLDITAIKYEINLNGLDTKNKNPINKMPPINNKSISANSHIFSSKMSIEPRLESGAILLNFSPQSVSW